MTTNAAALWILFAVIVGSGLCIFIRYRILRSKLERKQREWLSNKRLLETESEDLKK